MSDFEPGLFRRKRAAYLLSEALGWGFVPPTVIREDTPLGGGSLQWFIDCDFREHYFTLYRDAPETHPDLKLCTVIWDFAGDTIPEALLEDIAPLADKVPPEVADMLDGDEVAALQRRAHRLLHARALPADPTGIRYPWPLV